MLNQWQRSSTRSDYSTGSCLGPPQPDNGSTVYYKTLMNYNELILQFVGLCECYVNANIVGQSCVAISLLSVCIY